MKPNIALLSLAVVAVAFLGAPDIAEAADKRTPPPELGTMEGLEAQAFYVGVNAVTWGYPLPCSLRT